MLIGFAVRQILCFGCHFGVIYFIVPGGLSSGVQHGVLAWLSSLRHGQEPPGHSAPRTHKAAVPKSGCSKCQGCLLAELQPGFPQGQHLLAASIS